MDDQQKLNRLRFLSHSIFINSPDGKELLNLLKWKHLKNRVFPLDPIKLAWYGGALGYATFREGEMNIIRTIENDAADYIQRLDAEMRETTIKGT